jgi:hypothetical protein
MVQCYCLQLAADGVVDEAWQEGNGPDLPFWD